MLRMILKNKALAASIFLVAVMALWAQAAGAAASSPGKAVVVDPGHGGYDAGIVYNSPEGVQINEKDTDLKIAKAVISTLRASGMEAFATRTVDRYMDISQRATAAQAKSPGLFLSVHLSSTGAFNIYVTSLPQDQADPKQFYLYSNRQRPYLGESRDFASALEQSIKQAFPGVSVIYMEIPLPLLDEIGAPAVMLECPSPAYFNYRDPAVAGHIAQAVAVAVTAFDEKK